MFKWWFMIEHLEKWIYINSIENEKLKQAWQLILETNMEPIILSSKAYILKHFYELINDKISLEDFYMTWDIHSNLDTKIETFIKNPYDFFEYIKDGKEADKLYIIDDIFKWHLERKDIFYI